ncbi:MAG TPA: EAL domain-containing protein [Capillimicrobium sp.]|nr:EAL domain-containing protein [Capillimicrobium sp.]
MPAAPRLHRAVAVPLALVVGLFALQTVVHAGGPGFEAAVRNWVPIAVYVTAAGLCAARALAVRPDRAAWLLIAAGIAAYAAGSLVWVLGGPDRPVEDVPPVAHALWLGFYAAGYVGIGLLLRARVRPFEVSFWLDGLLGAITLAAVTAGFLVPAFRIPPGVGTLEVVGALGYSAGDVLLLAMTVWALWLGGPRRGRMWAVLALAFAVMAAGDIGLALEVAAGTYQRGTAVSAAFPAGMALVALAAYQPARSAMLRMGSLLTVAMPIVWAVACLALLAFEDEIALSHVAHVLALLGLCVAVVRAVVTLLELGSVKESRRFERGFQDAAIGMAVVSLDLRPQRVNDRLCRLLGRDASELTGVSFAELTHPDDRALLERLTVDGATPVELRLLRADGTVADTVVTTAIVGDDEPDPYLFAQIEDVTARRRAERQTAAAAELGRRAIRITDVTALMREVVDVVSRTLGTPACYIGRSGRPGWGTMIATTDPAVTGRTVAMSEGSCAAVLLRTGRPVISNDVAADPRLDVHELMRERSLNRVIGVPVPRRADGSYVLVAHRTARDPEFAPEDVHFLEAVATVLATALDRSETDAATRHQALHDPLTGLANRTFLRGQLDQALAGSRRDRASVALLLLDVDRFKLVNDTIGHSAGDTVLCEVADRLRALVRGGDIAARLGGDEFVVACAGVTDERDVAALAERIVAAFADPFHAGGRSWHLAASVGVALGGDGATADELLRDADLAMYRAKDHGGGRYEIFDNAMRARVVQRLGLEAALHAAVERGELTLHYQPIVSLAAGELEGFEALLRWEHPERGLVGPDEFIAIAEDTDLILPIGHWVLRTACEQIAAWNAACPDRPPVRVRVNLSPRQITPALAAAVGTAVRQTGIAASQLGLEITERLLVEEPTASSILDEVRELGVRVALDDFGTGYSSLSYLKSYPVDVLKLDRSLIAELGSSPEATAIVKAAVDMALALELCVVAEGVEEAAQAQELRRLGCTCGQGFLFSRPLPLHAADALLASTTPFAAAHG